jgi:UDP-3-O-[3-hydroxymyristoyl] glucosamine N-acyltransferase
MQLTAGQIAQMIEGQVEGDANVTIVGPSKIEEGGPGTITFLANPKYEEYAYTTTASAMLVPDDFKPRAEVKPTLIRVPDVYAAVAQLLGRFGAALQPQLEGQSDEAFIDPSSEVAEDAAIGAFAVVSAGAVIESGVTLYPQVYVGHGVRIGAGSTLYPGVRVYHGCEIGNQCVIHANAVIGSDGFGFNRDASGAYEKVPQIGKVILEDQVEIGANTVIDRATMGATIIRKGAKLDNLIQIAHNVEVGNDTVIAAQAGIAGSTKVGARSLIGGQVGIVGHIQLADGVRIQAQSGVNRTVKEEGAALYGSPALDYNQFLRAFAIFRKLPDLEARLRKLEKGES